jgi:predicted nucleic acid-binding protein
MAAYFIDSSALVKRYAIEVGTSWVISLFRPAAANPIYVVRITSVEVHSALTRRMRGGSIGPNDYAKAIARFRRAFTGKFRVAEVTGALIERADGLVETHGLRGYDAVQLAAALTINEARVNAGASSVTLVSADDPLNSAATVEGLMVENPNLHP